MLHFLILNMPQRFVCFVNSHISLHGLRFPLRFVFLQVEISSSCYCRGRAPPLTGKCFGCHLADIRQRCLPSFSPVPEGSGVVTGPALWWGLWSGAVCLLFCKTNKRMLCSAPARPPVPLAGVSRPSVFVLLISVLHYSVLFGLFLLEAVRLELF